MFVVYYNDDRAFVCLKMNEKNLIDDLLKWGHDPEDFVREEIDDYVVDIGSRVEIL